MTIKASGRSALILATGLFVCFAGPSQAAAGADDCGRKFAIGNSPGAPVALNKYAKHGSRHWKSYAHRKSGKVALKSACQQESRCIRRRRPTTATNASAIPPSVANANAQLAAADTPTGNAPRPCPRGPTKFCRLRPDKPADAQPAAETQVVVAADQLNDVDRALRESKPPAATAGDGLGRGACRIAAAPVVASSSESSTWDQTSLIGKIFIGFGALLTMASAARMFMA